MRLRGVRLVRGLAYWLLEAGLFAGRRRYCLRNLTSPRHAQFLGCSGPGLWLWRCLGSVKLVLYAGPMLLQPAGAVGAAAPPLLRLLLAAAVPLPLRSAAESPRALCRTGPCRGPCCNGVRFKLEAARNAPLGLQASSYDVARQFAEVCKGWRLLAVLPRRR